TEREASHQLSEDWWLAQAAREIGSGLGREEYDGQLDKEHELSGCCHPPTLQPERRQARPRSRRSMAPGTLSQRPDSPVDRRMRPFRECPGRSAPPPERPAFR